MPALSAVCSADLLDKEFGAVNYTPETSHFLALYSVAPAADGSGGTELPIADGYDEVEIPNNKTSWTNASAKTVLNAIEFAFAQATADWPAAVAIALKTAGGAVRAHGALEEPITVASGKTCSFAIGAMEIVFA